MTGRNVILLAAGAVLIAILLLGAVFGLGPVPIR